MMIRAGTFEAKNIRKVFLNGRTIKHVVSADEAKGKITVARFPLKIHKYKKRILLKTIYGRVELERVGC
jgi:hypothetical protein